ncbi:DNA -binding domain-containing protein [Xenophilus sp.]|uniref:DNA -binding domain-containing protein n=1 Tax=Xenophilus sp. TaxID=1873499 RepID=UPI0037DCDDD6
MGTHANDWHPAAAYLYALTLDGPSLAWEYLRRNPHYRSDYGRHACGSADEAADAAPWGLRMLEDPSRDARYAQPAWLPDPDGLPQLHPDAGAAPDAPTFALWRMPGRKQLAHDGQRMVLNAYRPEGTLRVAFSPALEHGMAYAHGVAGGARLRERWRAAAATVERLDAFYGRDAARPGAHAHSHGHAHGRPDRIALLHMRSLQTLDGLAAGATQREIAQALFGMAVVAERWHDLGELRAQVRRLARRGRALVDGGYRRLLQIEAIRDGRLD